MNWKPISEAPKPEQWLRTSGHFLLARFRQNHDEDGEAVGLPELAWAQVAKLTADGWKVSTSGFVGASGYAEFLMSGASHFVKLPDELI